MKARAHWSWRAALWTTALAAGGYLVAVLVTGWAEVSAALARIGVGGLAVALLLSGLNYGLRFLRWQGYLRALGTPVPTGPSLRIYLAGFALTATPGKAGEALRGVLLRPHGVGWPQSLAAFFSERMADLLAIVLLALVGLSLHPGSLPWVAAAALLLLAGYLALAIPHWPQALQRAITARGPGVKRLLPLLDVVIQARRCHAPRLLLTATVLIRLATLWFAVLIGMVAVGLGTGADDASRR